MISLTLLEFIDKHAVGIAIFVILLCVIGIPSIIEAWKDR